MTDQKKAALAGGSHYYTREDFSTNAHLDSIAAAVAGQRAGAEIVQDLRTGVAAPDALHDRLLVITDPAFFRAFCRVLQKNLEQGNELPALRRGPR